MNPDVSDASPRALVRIWNAFKEALFPLTCLMCGQFYLRRSDRSDSFKRGVSINETIQAPPSAALFDRLMAPYLCPVCSQQFTPIESPCCTCCGVMFKSREGTDHLCGECLNSKRYFGMARAVGVYDQALMAVIHGFKYGEKVGMAAPLSILLLSAYHHFWHDRPMDVVVPVPLFGRRLRKRGFNQVYLAIRHWENRKWQGCPASTPHGRKRSAAAETIHTAADRSGTQGPHAKRERCIRTGRVSHHSKKEDSARG